MKQIDVSDEVYEALKRLTTDFHQSPNSVLATLLKIPSERQSADPLVAYTLAAEFRGKFTDAERYLALLGWIARRHRPEFDEFIQHQSSGRRYLGLTREEIVEQCRYNQARPIPDTPYWAIMNLDTATKRRFLGRVLEFIGYRDEVIELAASALGMRRGTRLGF